MYKVSKVVRLGVVFAGLMLPFGATAATIDADLSANQNYTDGFTLNPDETQQYNFTVLEDLRIAEFSVSGSGTNAGEDLSDITFGLESPPVDSFDSVQTEMGVSAALDFVPGATFKAGEEFSFYFKDGIDEAVSMTLSFDTEVIPLPAGGVLLLTAVAGGAALARRRKQRG